MTVERFRDREPPARSGQFVVEVVPVGIASHDRAGLVGAVPALHGGLALDRGLDLVVPFVPDETFQPVLLREAGNQARAMLVNAPAEIARHADVERAVRSVRHDVDPAALLLHGVRMR